MSQPCFPYLDFPGWSHTWSTVVPKCRAQHIPISLSAPVEATLTELCAERSIHSNSAFQRNLYNVTTSSTFSILEVGEGVPSHGSASRHFLWKSALRWLAAHFGTSHLSYLSIQWDLPFWHSYTKDWARPAGSLVRGPGLGPLRVRGPIQRGWSRMSQRCKCIERAQVRKSENKDTTHWARHKGRNGIMNMGNRTKIQNLDPDFYKLSKR